MSRFINPKARQNGLLTSKIGVETVAYDTETDRASCLNELAATVWKACDGNNDIGSIVDILRSAGFQEATDEVVLMAIDRLDKSGLLEVSVEIDETNRKNLNRREMLRILGARSAALLPVISTIVVPPAIAAASIPLGEPCNSTRQCVSGYCCAPNGNSSTGRCSLSCPPGHRI